MTILSMLIAQQRENDRLLARIRQLEEALAQQKTMTADALDREAVLLAEQTERGRLQ